MVVPKGGGGHKFVRDDHVLCVCGGGSSLLVDYLWSNQ